MSKQYLWTSIAIGFVLGLFLIQPLGLSLFLYDSRGDQGDYWNLFKVVFVQATNFGDFAQILKNLLFAILGSSLALMFIFRKRIFLLNGKQMDRHTVLELINKGESSRVEFKSSLRWDVRQNKVNKQLEFIIVKTIAAFMNTDGGKLLIGVDDNGSILGLNQDFETLKKPDKDGFEQYLMQLVSLKLGTHLCTGVNVFFYRYGENDVCYLEIGPARMPVYVSQDGRSLFYIRTGNGTRELDLPEAILHIGRREGALK